MTRIHVHGWKHLPESKGVVKDRDGGDDRDVRRLTKSFLAAGGVNWLGRQGLIHGDIRHYGGSAYLRQKFKTRQIVTGPARFHSTEYRALLSSLGTPPGRLRTNAMGDPTNPAEFRRPRFTLQ